MNKTNFKQMAELLGEIVDGWTVNCPTRVAEEFSPKIKELLKKIDYSRQCSACSKFYVASTLQHRECCNKSFCNGELFPCVKDHDLTCKTHKKNLEKFREEKEAQFTKGIVVDTRISKKQASEKGLVQCSCHRYFAPEVKRKNSRGEDVYYKSCLTCRNKRTSKKSLPDAPTLEEEPKPEKAKPKKMKPRSNYIIPFDSFKEHLSHEFPKNFHKKVQKEYGDDVEVLFLPVSEEEKKKHAPNLRPTHAVIKIEILEEVSYVVYNTSSPFALWLCNFDEEVTDDEEGEEK